MQHKRNSLNWTLYAAALLLCLVLVSTHLLGGLYARYATSASAADGARVAEFFVTDKMLDEGKNEFVTKINELDLLPGDSKNYQIQVTSQSEVAVRYTVQVENKTRNLPLELHLTNETNEIPANDTEPRTIGLTIEWPEDKNTYTYNRNVELITITVTYQQID